MSAEAAVLAWLEQSGLEWEQSTPGTYVVVLPGEHKLKTTVALTVGEHALTVNAFVARHPDENTEAVHRWLLERNQRLYAVAFAVDQCDGFVGEELCRAVCVELVDRG